jgi:hypothetical protein
MLARGRGAAKFFSTDPPVHLLNLRPTHPPSDFCFWSFFFSTFLGVSRQGEFKNTTKKYQKNKSDPSPFSYYRYSDPPAHHGGHRFFFWRPLVLAGPHQVHQAAAFLLPTHPIHTHTLEDRARRAQSPKQRATIYRRLRRGRGGGSASVSRRCGCAGNLSAVVDLLARTGTDCTCSHCKLRAASTLWVLGVKCPKCRFWAA